MFTAAVHLRLHCTERRRHSLSASKSRELPKLFTGLSKSINHELNTQKNQFPDPQQECCISVCVHNGPGWLLRITHKTSLQNCQSWEMSSLCYLTSTLSIYGFQTSMPVSKLWRSLFRTFNQTLHLAFKIIPHRLHLLVIEFKHNYFTFVAVCSSVSQKQFCWLCGSSKKAVCIMLLM